MINIIYEILTANDNEQHKDNNDIAMKYLQANKDKILDLVEKNYENLVEALTNNAIDPAFSSSDPISSLSQASSTFLNLANQGGTYRIEGPESFRQNKGDIVD